MISTLLDTFFGCWHSRYSFPISVKTANLRVGAAFHTGTYVVCLDCGKELPYDWKKMKVVSPSRKQAARMRSLATKEAA